MKKGDKVICKETINNIIGNPLFIKGYVYEVLYVDNESIKTEICLNHIMYANEHVTFPLEWVSEKFKIINER